MKRVIRSGLVFVLMVCMIVSWNMLFAGPAVFAAGSPAPEYSFDKNKTAVKQLEDLFTTIDIMDATIEGLTEEMEAGNVTSEQITQMYIDRIRAYDSKLKLNSVISIRSPKSRSIRRPER